MNKIDKISKLLSVMSDKTRLKIMFCLLDESRCSCPCDNCGTCSHLCCMVEKSVSEIVEITKCEQSLISHQLKILKDAGVVGSRKEGKKMYYSLLDGHIKQLLRVATEHIEE